MTAINKYPIGQQDFKSLREDGCVYVDKTKFIEKIITQSGRYLFLSRPRRFGKSLFLSTLQYFFEGRRELFSGLYIDSTLWNWEPYPVLHIDLNTERYSDKKMLKNVIESHFREWEGKYAIQPHATELSQRFKMIIEAAHRITGRQVVILIDEYDKPLVSNINNDENFEYYRGELAALYSNFKSSAEHIRLVFLTGVSRFSKLSVFSDLNNIDDISFDDEYSDICGITETELTDTLRNGIKSLACKRNISYEETCRSLKRNYDGYKFSPSGDEIYNPWSVLCCLSKGRIGNYWNQTGMPTIIAESLHKIDIDLKTTLNTRCNLDSLEGLDLKSPNPVALLYQTGYLTIKDYDFETDIINLGIPNIEVEEGLMTILLPYYIKTQKKEPEGVIFDIIDDIRQGRPKDLMDNLDIYFAGIPYSLKMENENNFQNAIFILLSLIGINVRTEVQTSDGRIDLLIETPKYIYVIELKYGYSALTALSQIEEKQYRLMFKNDSRKVFRIGANFSKETRKFESISIEEKT